MSDFSLLYEIGTLKESLSTMKIRALQAEIECDKWKAEAEVKTELYNAEYETALRYMRERDDLQKQLEWQTKELNRLRIIEQGLSDFQNDMLPNATAENVYAWIESTTGFKNIYQEPANEKN